MDNSIKFSQKIKLYKRILFTILFSIILYVIAALYNSAFIEIVSIADYLTWHMIFEFASILISFSIFTVTFFVYEESANLNMILLGCAFLTMGFLDAFHTFSFQGMPDFFVSNSEANRATTLWILSRLLGSLGLLLAVSIPANIRSNRSRYFFASITVGISLILFVIVTYYPNLLPSMHNPDGSLSSIKIVMEYVVIGIMLVTLYIVVKNFNRTSLKLDHQFIIALIFLIFSEFSFTNYGSVYDAYNYIGHLYKIIAFLILYKAIYIVNVSQPYREMKKARNELKEYSENLNSIVEERTNELVELNSNLLKDIEYAREMQLRLIPERMPQDLSLSFYAEYLPAERLSGDFYNVVQLDKDNVAIYIGDVSGHGVAAAMLTVFAYQSITPIKYNSDDNSNYIVAPNQVLYSLYRNFNDTNFDDSTYIVMLYGIYNKKSKLFKYASAGLNVNPYLIKGSGEVEELNSKGFAICKLGEYVTPTYVDRSIRLETGDKLLLYSDGLVEAKSENFNVHGQEEMKSFLENNGKLDGMELESRLTHNLNSDNLEDDITFLIMEVN